MIEAIVPTSPWLGSGSRPTCPAWGDERPARGSPYCGRRRSDAALAPIAAGAGDVLREQARCERTPQDLVLHSPQAMGILGDTAAAPLVEGGLGSLHTR